MASTRKCLCCENTYEYCPSCGNSNKPWKFNYDTEECRDLFNAVSGFNIGVAGLEKVEQVLKQYNITDFSKYKDSIRIMLTKNFGKASKIAHIIDTEEVIETPIISEESVKSENVADVVEIEPKTEETVEEENLKYVSNTKRRRSRFFE